MALADKRATASNEHSTFEGLAAIVTGGASGIGWATVRALASAGASVAVVDRDGIAADEAAHDIVKAGGRAIAITADISDETEVEAMVARTLDLFGRLDCAFNNAGVAHPNMPCAEIDPAVWDNVISVNLRGTWLCMRAEIPRMLAGGGGSIVNTASISALRGMPGLSAYTASKHAILGLTRAAAREYASHGIRINAVCPGAVHTPMTDKALEGLAPAEAEEMLRQRASNHAIGRLGTVDEIADAVCFLLGDRSSFIVGQGISVDGGWAV